MSFIPVMTNIFTGAITAISKCHMVLQKSFLNADLVLKKHFLLIINIYWKRLSCIIFFLETMIKKNSRIHCMESCR